MLMDYEETDIHNPGIIVQDGRIERLDAIVTEVKQSEEWEEVHMSILKVGMMRGKQEDILELLQEYGSVPEGLQEKIQGETDTEILRKWHKLAARVSDIEEFERLI